MLSQFLDSLTWMSSLHRRGGIISNKDIWKHYYTMLLLILLVNCRFYTFICSAVFQKHLIFFFNFSFGVTKFKPASSNMRLPLGSEVTAVYVGRCTSQQTECRGRYYRCCIEYIFGASLPVTVVTVHRFSSISERRTKRIPRPLHSLLIYFFLREYEVELGEEEEERGGLDEEWRRKVEEEIWGWMNWNENETAQKWLKLASWTQPLTWHCWIYRIPSNVVYLMRPSSVWKDYSEGKCC